MSEHEHKWSWIWSGVVTTRIPGRTRDGDPIHEDEVRALRACECGEAELIQPSIGSTPRQQEREAANAAWREAERAKRRAYNQARKARREGEE
jgi:hypothetical protein